MKKAILLFLVASSLTGFYGCKPPGKEMELNYDRPLGPGENALVKITDPEKIPDFTVACACLENLQEAVDNSLNYLSKPSSQQFFPMQGITHQRVKASLEEFSDMLDSDMLASELNRVIRKKFDVYMSVGCDKAGTVLFTGYYTPIFDGSLKRTEKFKYPLYKQPEDLVKTSTGQILGRRLPDGSIVSYPSRAELRNCDALDGNELVWLSNPFEVYIAHVQGSAKIRLGDGQLKTVGYAANNGQPYKSISKLMVKRGVISSENLSLSAMIDYFDSHPDQIDSYVSENPRFVFFRMQEGPPRGSLNEPVIPLRSIATDKDIFPRASLCFIATNLPQMVAGQVTDRIYDGFALDQDTGGAIRAPGRCDVYIGQGADAAKLAGQTYREGRLYYLFLKDSYYINRQ